MFPASLPALAGGLLLLLLVPAVAADCECGYATGDGLVFAHLFESDFAHVDYLDGGKGWAPQAFNKSAEAARGPYGQAFTTANVVSNVEGDKGGGGGGDAGLGLIVDSQPVDGALRNGELASTEDFFYGSYRVGMKVTDVAGTCSAFFWYANDTQEIDIEFLSAEFDRTNGTFPVNLVLQTAEARAAGYDAARTGTFVRRNLPFDPTDGTHEYRFDFAAGGVGFYADGAPLARMDAAAGGVPVVPGRLMLSHWSNGNAQWSRGPPARDARTVVSYVKAYFNSTDDDDGGEHEARCTPEHRARPGGAVCALPDHDPAFFFSDPKDNATLTGHGNGAAAAAGGSRSGLGLAAAAALGAVFWVVGL